MGFAIWDIHLVSGFPAIRVWLPEGFSNHFHKYSSVSHQYSSIFPYPINSPSILHQYNRIPLHPHHAPSYMHIHIISFRYIPIISPWHQHSHVYIYIYRRYIDVVEYNDINPMIFQVLSFSVIPGCPLGIPDRCARTVRHRAGPALSSPCQWTVKLTVSMSFSWI